MPKTLDPHQLQKIDRRFNRPIYLIHFPTIEWQKKYVFIVDDLHVITSYGTKKIEGEGDPNLYKWVTAGVAPGDKFQLCDYATTEWKEIGTVDYVEDENTLYLTENYPAYAGCGYKIWQDVSLHFSDRNFYYNSINYEDYLFDLSEIGNQIRQLGGYDNAKVTLTFKDNKIRSFDHLIDFFDELAPEKSYVEIYRLFADKGETFASDVATKIFKGELGQPYQIVPGKSFKMDLSSMLFGKDLSLPLNVIDLADFPYADPDDVGKYRNRIIGSHKKVVCRWTDGGWASTLTAAISDGQTSIEVSDAVSAPSSGSIICDAEEMYVSSKAGNTLTILYRGYNSTDAVSHSKGATIYQKKTDFEAEVADHPVKSIGDVYVKKGNSEWLRMISGVTKYADAEGRAFLQFSDKPKFEQEADLEVGLEQEPHDHTLSGATSIQKECIPTGSSGPTGHQNVIDGNEGSYCAVAESVTVTASFTESDIGTISKQYLWVLKLDTGSGIMINGTGPYGAGASGWIRVSGTGGEWNTEVTVTGGSGGNQIGEIYKIVEYTPYLAASNEELGPYLEGNSVANMVIGDVVACDVEGYADDGSGTYTGTPNALIERPDHVRKLFLMGFLGFSADDIGASFATVGAIYASRISGGYKFAFVTHEVATQTMEFFRQLDLQSRSNMFESGGKFVLSFGSTSTPTSQKTFDSSNVRGDFVFGKTEIADIRNKLIGHYFRDYSKTGGLGEIYRKVKQKTDSTSIGKYGEMKEEIEFSCIGDLTTMVVDVLDWIIYVKKDLKKTVSFSAFWDAAILEHCDHFTVNTVLQNWTGLKFKTLLPYERPREQVIDLKGLEIVP